MCIVALAPIAQICGANVPGAKRVHVINHAEVETVPAADANSKTISADLTLVATKFFNEFIFAKDGAEHTEESNTNGSVNGRLEMDFPKDDDTKRYMFEQMQGGGKFAVAYVDGNGLQKYIRECYFEWNYKTGRSGDDVNGYIAAFTYTDVPAFIYTGAVLTA